MGEGTKKTSISTILLIIAIGIIAVQAIFNYQFCMEKQIAERRVESLTAQISNLEGNVGTYRSTLDEIARLVNEALYPVSRETANSQVIVNPEISSEETIEGIDNGAQTIENQSNENNEIVE